MFNFNNLFHKTKTEEVAPVVDVTGEVTEGHRDMTDEEINLVFDSVGGNERYRRIMAWSKACMTDAHIDAYDELVNTGEVEEVIEEAKKIANRFQAAFDEDPEMVDRLILSTMESSCEDEDSGFDAAVGSAYTSLKPSPGEIGETVRNLIFADINWHKRLIESMDEGDTDEDMIAAWAKDLQKLEAALVLLENV